MWSAREPVCSTGSRKCIVWILWRRCHVFNVKDSGERIEFNSGMVRDVDTDKTNFALIADGPMLVRWAEHLTKGAKKYAARNWMLASGVEEYNRFRESAFRHFMQWYLGEDDEDHAAAVFFNINGAEYSLGHYPATAPPLARLGDKLKEPRPPTPGSVSKAPLKDANHFTPYVKYRTSAVPSDCFHVVEELRVGKSLGCESGIS